MNEQVLAGVVIALSPYSSNWCCTCSICRKVWICAKPLLRALIASRNVCIRGSRNQDYHTATLCIRKDSVPTITFTVRIAVTCSSRHANVLRLYANGELIFSCNVMVPHSKYLCTNDCPCKTALVLLYQEKLQHTIFE